MRWAWNARNEDDVRKRQPPVNLLFSVVAFLQAVVRRFASDRHVVRVRLAQSRGGNAHETSLCAKLLDRAATDVAHSAAQATDHLEQHVGDRPSVRHAALYPLRNELLRRELAFLEVAVGAAILHRG